jgi:CDP-diacylglycerol--glycerol-3-phosphate 3-phosphatidyltransferase
VKPFGLGWPNIVSAVRIAMAPVMLWFIVRPGETAAWIAFWIFAVGAATDKLDGYLARRLQVQTNTGAWLDPLADKLFVIGPMVVLSLQGRFPWWATALVIVREAAVSLLRWSLDRRGAPMPASPMAKAKAVLQVVAVGAYLVPGIAGGIRLGLLLAALLITAYSGAEYFLKAEAHVLAAKARAVRERAAGRRESGAGKRAAR